MPKEYRAEGIIKGLGKIKGKNILLPRAEVAREILPEELNKRGAKVDVVTSYRTVKPKERTEEIKELFKEGKIDIVTFTSSSTVTNFLSMFKNGEAVEFLKNAKVASIGPITRDTALDYGIETAIMPKKYTIPALAEAIVEHFKGK